MSDTCATCYFGRLAPASAGVAAGRRFCHGGLPYDHTDLASSYPWRAVADDWWCGAGADATSGRGYADRTGAAVIDPAVISDSGR